MVTTTGLFVKRVSDVNAKETHTCYCSLQMAHEGVRELGKTYH